MIILVCLLIQLIYEEKRIRQVISASILEGMTFLGLDVKANVYHIKNKVYDLQVLVIRSLLPFLVLNTDELYYHLIVFIYIIQ